METSEIAGKRNEDVRSGHEKQISSLSSSRLSEGEIAMPNDDKQTQLAEENVDVNSKSRQEDQNLGNTDNVESPYRIPSSVFKRNASQAPMEWSVASNESLFSIHVGNMSFTRDQAFFGKSGELGLPGEITMSAPVSPFGNHSSKRIPSIPSPVSSAKYNAPPTAEVETIKENDVSKETPKKKSHHSASFRRSDVSCASVKSFAFPILTDNKGDNSKHNASLRSSSQPQTPKVPQDSPQKSQLETSNPGTNTKPPSSGGLNRWFACLPCCNSSRS